MRTCSLKNSTILFLITISVFMSCGKEEVEVPVIPPEEPVNQEVVEKNLNKATTEWGMSQESLIAYMDGYSIVSGTGNELLHFKTDKSTQRISYRLNNGKLCATVIVFPSTSTDSYIQNLLNGFSYLGELSAGKIYENHTANTMAVVWQPVENDSSFSAIGFAPIESNAYKKIEPIIVETGEANDIKTKSVTISGKVSGIDNDVEVGVIYGKDNDLSEYSELKQKTSAQSDFTVTISELGSETTYYYRAYAIVDETYYFGDVKSFTTMGYTNTFTFNETVYTMILVEGCPTGDFYIMDKEIPGTAFDKNGDGKVSYNEERAMISSMINETGIPLRVPYIKEWQYAAKGGNKSKGYKYSGSDTYSEVAWYYGNSNQKPHSSGEKQPNELGIFDMSGNWAEVCMNDNRQEDYYFRDVVCGGSCDNSVSDCRTTSYKTIPNTGNWRNCTIIYDSSKEFGHIGFRLVYTKGK